MLFTQVLVTVIAGLQIVGHLTNTIDRVRIDRLAHFSTNDKNNSTRLSYNEQVSLKLGAINRAQQAHFFETRSFSSRYYELGLGRSQENERYQLIVGNRENLAFSYAIPKTRTAKYKKWSGSSWIDAKEPLYSYVSAIHYSKDNGSFQSILCASDLPDRSKLDLPEVVDGQLVCSPETEEIFRNN